MHNGSEDFDNNGDDEASRDEESFIHPTDLVEVVSDQDPCNSEEGPSSNDNKTLADEDNDEEEIDGEGSEEGHDNNNEQVVDFIKLLPYLYLMQRNYGDGVGQGFSELSSNNLLLNNAHKSSNSLLDSESFKNQYNTLRYLQNLLPNSGLLYNEHNSNEINNEEDEMEEESSEHEEPLDLTQKNQSMMRAKDDKLIRSSQRPERGYTIKDLEAALNDIQSGKLGTRRAAVIYGIPRSTLRNKVYKLGKNLATSKTSEEYTMPSGKAGERQLGFGITKGGESNTKDPTESGEDYELHGSNNGTSHKFNVHQELKYNGDIYRNNPCSLLRIDTLAGSEMDEGGRNQLLFSGGGVGGRNYSNQRGRNGSSPSLLSGAQCNYPRAEGSSNYDSYNDSSSLGKKSRPKRGKYRNYDREALAKAVLAVQNGEMSVHRAGSFFGVPHSTLEYKVKERHLLRQAKFKGKSNPKPVINKLDSSALTDSNDSSNLQNLQKPMPSALRRSLSQYLAMRQNNNHSMEIESRWRPSELLGIKESVGGSKKEINDPFPKIYDSNESCSHLLDLTRKT